MHKIELLAPAGSKEAFLAAIAAGADAIFFGTNQFNARERAENIKLEDLPELLSIAKNHKVRTYLTLNVLIYNDELESALELVRKVTNLGADAIIVQDIGIFSLIRKNFPNVEIHASTQLTTHNLEQCKFLVKMGAKQINLSRELSLEEIKPIAKYLKEQNVGCEIFIHGAYCISYSGQCYLSGNLYDLKGNRGACVQPCRREYCKNPDFGTFSASQKNSITQQTFSPFNLKDNCAFPLLKELIEAGATSLKIEGRIKSAEYVYNVTKAYREQLDRIYNDEPVLQKDSRLDFSMNRSFSTGYLEGKIQKEMFTYGHKDHSLVFYGKVFSYHADKNILTILNQSFSTKQIAEKEDLKPGFLLTILNHDKSFVCTAIIEEKLSINEYKIKITGKLSNKIKRDCEVYFSKVLISKEELSNEISNLKPQKYLISAQVDGKAGAPLKATFFLKDFSKNEPVSFTANSTSLLQPASNKALTKDVILEKFSRLGGTDFCLENLEVSSDFAKEPLFLSLGELNNLRRLAVEHFQSFLQKESLIPETSLSLLDKKDFIPFPKYFFTDKNKMNPIFFFDSIKTFNQFSTDFDFSPKNYNFPTSLLEIPLTLSKEQDVYIDFFENNPNVIPYFSSILFQNHFIDVVNFLKLAKPKNIVADNLGLIEIAEKLNINVIFGYHLNIFNSASAHYFSKINNCKGIILSSELSKEDFENFDIPAHTEIWLPDTSSIQLMQSRQCLLRNIPDSKTGLPCSKPETDSSCIENCSRTETIFGSQKEKIIAKKRKGFYSALFPLPQELVKPNYQSLIERFSEPQKKDLPIIRQIFYIN